MLTVEAATAKLRTAFPGVRAEYQEEVAHRMVAYFTFLEPHREKMHGSILDVAGQVGNFLFLATEMFPSLTNLSLTHHRPVGNLLHAGPAHIKVYQFHCERDRLAIADKSQDVAVFTEVLEHLLYDPVWTMMEINRVLRDDGLLFLATPNAGSLKSVVNILHGKNPAGCIEYKPTLPFERHNRIYTSREALRLIETVGFNVISFSTGASKKVRAAAAILEACGIAAKGFNVHCGGQTMVLARKTKHCDSLLNHERETRWPSWLYSPRPELCVRPKQFIESDDV